MAAWSGFTDEDLRKMRSHSQEGDDNERRNTPSKRGMARRPRGSASRSKMDRAQAVAPSTPSPPPNIGRDERLSVDKGKKDVLLSKESMLSGGKPTTDADAAKHEGVVTSSSTKDSSEPVGLEMSAQSEVVELSTDQALSLERDNVVKFQQQQKVIEEANKQKRALLSKAIEERRKMAKAEAQKLLKIQQELNHLDTLLNADVGIIRDKIETASLDYAQAQKRYEKAEKEFIEAKMDLYEKSEAKEKLTEHLYTIINQNEVRKAKKLVELMEQLAMQISPEEMEMSMPSIPQLTNFTAASTIHQPGYVPTGTRAGPKDSEKPISDANDDSNNVADTAVENCKVEDKKTEGARTGIGASGDAIAIGSGCGKEEARSAEMKVKEEEGSLKSGGDEARINGDNSKAANSSATNEKDNNGDNPAEMSQLSQTLENNNDNVPTKSCSVLREGLSGQRIITTTGVDENVCANLTTVNSPPRHVSAANDNDKIALEGGSNVKSDSKIWPPSSNRNKTLTPTPDPNGNPPSLAQEKTTKAKGWSLPFT